MNIPTVTLLKKEEKKKLSFVTFLVKRKELSRTASPHE